MIFGWKFEANKALIGLIQTSFICGLQAAHPY